MLQQRVLDFRTAGTREEIHEILSRGLAFPPYYGANLDALWDCLSDLAFGDAQGEIVVLLPQEKPCPLYLRRVLYVLLEAEEDISLPVANGEEIREFLQKETPSPFPRSE